MAKARNRPLSPHLQIWKWGPHMAVSILHRTTGFILATAGVLTVVWWLWAISGGPEAYATFYKWVVFAGGDGTATLLSNIFFRILGVVVSWAFFQHFFSGLRHLLLDTGAGYELNTNKFWSLAVIIGALVATVILWLLVFLGAIGS
jgi:succinate dehydrogenase / fumarate reductase cytochrome b subunit